MPPRLVLEVGAEIVADDAGKTALPTWCSAYAEAGFKEELPEAVAASPTGRASRSRTSSRVSRTARLVYTADVTCAEIKFLQVRRAARLGAPS